MVATLLIGLSIAMLLFLLAAGLSLIFGMLGVVNFAHGALYMVGAFVACEVATRSGSFWLALAVAPIVVAVVGIVIEVGLLRPLYARDHVQQLMLTFGLILVLDEIVRLIWGVDYRSITPPGIFATPVHLFGENIATYRIFIVALGLAVLAALTFGIERTRLGMVLRAAMSNAPMTRCLGIRVDRIRTVVFALGAGLAALGGAAAAPLLSVQVGMGSSIIIDCFIVVVIGGLGSVRGTAVAALLLGLTQAFGQYLAPGWIEVWTLLVMIAVLLFRPQGLFGVKSSRVA
jgi:branched-chain amino acid transport system permease protein